MLDLNGKVVLITGGTGSFGNKFVETILRDYPKVKKIVIYSRGELKQYNMKQKYQLSFFLLILSFFQIMKYNHNDRAGIIIFHQKADFSFHENL